MASLDPRKLPRHIAIIPDGNGRWAEARGLHRHEGHRQGTEQVREIVRAVHELGIPLLTIYAFSSENWERPREEVDFLMALLENYLRSEADELHENGVRLRAIGRIEQLPPGLRAELATLVKRTEGNRELTLTFALAYGGRTELVDALQKIARAVESGHLDPDAIDEKLVESHLYASDLPDPDLLIRAGDECRISNFLLWQIAYAELYFSATLWPDFGKRQLVEALLAYQTRERRFGKIGAQLRKEGA